MADFTLTATPTFPEGASIGAYPASNWPTPALPSGVPVGAADDTQEVTDGEAAFTGLTSGTAYWAVAQVGGSYRYVRFIAGADSSGGSEGGSGLSQEEIEILIAEAGSASHSVKAVVYGEEAATARPEADIVLWIGSKEVEPENAEEDDVRVKF